MIVLKTKAVLCSFFVVMTPSVGELFFNVAVKDSVSLCIYLYIVNSSPIFNYYTYFTTFECHFLLVIYIPTQPAEGE